MSERERAQCLLFVAADRKPGCRRKSSRSPANSLTKGYALLPQSFRDGHPEVVELFSRNDIRVISNAQNDFFCQTDLKNFTLEMFEIQLVFESPESEDGPSNASTSPLILIDEFEKEAIGLLLSRDAGISCLLAKERTGYIRMDSDDDLKVIEHFISCGKDVEGGDIAYRHFKGGTILHFAVKRGPEKLVKLLLQHGVNVDAKRSDGMTPLHVAAKKGLVEVVKILLQHGSDVHAQTETGVEGDGGFTPLFFAHRNRHSEVVGLLLESRSDVNTQFYNFINHHSMHYLDSPEEKSGSLVKVTILYSATLSENFEEIKSILCHQPDLDNEYNKKAFHYILFELEDEFKDIFKQMTEYGFKIDYDMFDNSAKFLFGAIHKNCFEIVHKMVEAGVDVNEVFNCRLSEKLTPLHMAARHAGEDIIQLLLKHGADRNNELAGLKEFPIHGAIKSNNNNVVKYFIANKVNFPDKAHLVLVAAAYGNCKMVEFLLTNGYPLTNENEYNMAIGRAAYIGHIEIIEFLFKYGAQLGSEYVDYGVPLYDAIIGRHPEIFQAILDYTFANIQTIKYTEVFDRFERYNLLRSTNQLIYPEQYELCSKILAQQILKLEAASLCAFDQNMSSFWHADESIDDFRNRCEMEIAQMKTERVGGSHISFYDILTQNLSRLASFARNNNIVETMEDDAYRVKFPVYSSVLERQFKKGLQRKELMQQGMKTCSVLFPGKRFYNLPNEPKVKIINYLSNCDLLVLNNVVPSKTQSERQ